MRVSHKRRLEDLFILSGNMLNAKSPEERGRSTAALAINILTGSQSPQIWDILDLNGVPLLQNRRPRKLFDSSQLLARGTRSYIAGLNPQIPKGVESDRTSNETTTTIFKPLGCITLSDVPLVFLERCVEYPDILMCFDAHYSPDDGEELIPVQDIDFIAMDARTEDQKIKASYPPVTASRLIKLREESFNQGLIAA